jgi:hypothetical protein
MDRRRHAAGNSGSSSIRRPGHGRSEAWHRLMRYVRSSKGLPGERQAPRRYGALGGSLAENGRNRSRSFRSQRDAKAFDGEVARRKRLGTLSQLTASDRTLAELVEEWWRVYVPGLAANTRNTYLYVWNKHARLRLGGYRLRDLQPREFDRFKAELRAAGVGDPTVIKTLTMLQSVFSSAVLWDGCRRIRCRRSGNRRNVPLVAANLSHRSRLRRFVPGSLWLVGHEMRSWFPSWLTRACGQARRWRFAGRLSASGHFECEARSLSGRRRPQRRTAIEACGSCLRCTTTCRPTGRRTGRRSTRRSSPLAPAPCGRTTTGATGAGAFPAARSRHRSTRRAAL